MTTDTRNDTRFFGHPRGLSTLFFTEMWERFSYYGMRALLILYMTATAAKGGLAYSDEKAGIVYGVYIAMVYLLGLPGGWIADRFLGLQNAVLSGAVIIMTGHIMLAIPTETTFFVGLVCVMVGTGLLKPNISANVGRLYAPDDVRRDAGFSIYYMGINTGAFLAPLVCGYLAQSNSFRSFLANQGIDPNHSWHFGFGAAAVGMFFGIVQFILGRRHMGDAGRYPVPPKDSAEAGRNRGILIAILVAVFGIPALVGGLGAAGVIPLTAKIIGDVFGIVLAGIPIVLFTFMFAVGGFTRDEKKRLVLIMVLFFGAAVFWGCFEQAGSTLNLFAERHTERKLLFVDDFPASWYQSANAIMIIIFAPVAAALWLFLARRKKEPSNVFKFASAMFLVGAGFLVMLPAAEAAQNGERTTGMFLLSLYLLHTFGELCLSPVGLSSMTKLAPERIGGMVMGIWFLASSLGNYLAGRAAGVTATMTKPAFFTMMVIVPCIAGVILFILVRPMRKMMATADATTPTKGGH